MLVTPSAASALFIIATSLLSEQDHLVVVRPNYATNIETPRAIGCAMDFLDLAFEDGYRFDLDRLAALIRPNTRMISLTHPHNPTGNPHPARSAGAGGAGRSARLLPAGG